MTDDGATLAPDDAFELLGNETRVRILQTLGTADEPVPFSELHDRVGLRDSGQFNYHLNRLVGHFLQKTDAGYELRRAGERVVEAVLSGAVTDAPVLELTPVDHACPVCGAPVEAAFREERVELYCTQCPGNYVSEDMDAPTGDDHDSDHDHGYLGYHPLPPAGVHGRTAGEVFRAAATWGHLELMAASAGVCPRCSATLDRSVAVCESHDTGSGLCETCDRRHAVTVGLRCTNCIYDEAGPAPVALAGTTPLVAFLTRHGHSLVDPDPESHAAISAALNDYEETVVSTDPLRVRLKVTVDGDELALTVDENLSIVDPVGEQPPE